MQKKILGGLTVGVLLLGAASGTYGYVHSQNVEQQQKAAASSKAKSESISKKNSESKKKDQEQKDKKNKTTKSETTKTQDSDFTQQDDNVENDASSLEVSEFVGKYGQTYAGYVRAQDGLTVAQSLEQAETIGAGMTSGEIQDLNGLKQGYIVETPDGKLTEAESNNVDSDGYGTGQVSYDVNEPNANFTLQDGTKIHNDSNGDSYTEDGQKIGGGDTNSGWG